MFLHLSLKPLIVHYAICITCSVNMLGRTVRLMGAASASLSSLPMAKSITAKVSRTTHTLRKKSVYATAMPYIALTYAPSASFTSAQGVVQATIQRKLEAELQPVHLDIRNESHMHSVPKHSETHFRVVIVSPRFNGATLVKRHRLVNEQLKHELQTGVHALSILAYTEEEWKNMMAAGKAPLPSPNCRGGSKHDL